MPIVFPPCRWDLSIEYLDGYDRLRLDYYEDYGCIPERLREEIIRNTMSYTAEMIGGRKNISVEREGDGIRIRGEVDPVMLFSMLVHEYIVGLLVPLRSKIYDNIDLWKLMEKLKD